MLDSNIKTQLKAYFEKIAAPITLTASVDGSPASAQMLELLNEVAEQTDKLTVKTDGQAKNVPSFTVSKTGEEARITFAGLPMGHEMTSFILAILQASGYPPKVEEDILARIRKLDGKFHFQTFISLSCHNCPDVVQALNLMAAINPNVEHEMIDGALYQNLVDQYQIMAVPTVILNGEVFGQGRMGAEEIIAKLDTGSAEEEAAKLNAKEDFDVLVIGGGPAGSAAAIYAARKGIRTGIVAERFGGQVMDTLGIENFISVSHTEGPKLVQALEQHVKDYEVDIMNLQRANALKKTSHGIEVEMANGAKLKSKSVIISTGARWREMNVPGEQEYRNKGVAYCPHCDGPLFKGKRVAVIGGGNSGVEAAIDLAGVVSHVTLIEFDSQLRADAVLQKKLFSLPNVTVIKSALTKEVLGDGSKVNSLRYEDRTTKADHTLELEGIFVQIGLLPNTEWLKGTIDLSPRGEIIVDAKGETSLPGVFAAGDCTTVPYKQIIIAMGEGAKASLGAFDYLIRHSVSEEEPSKIAA
ncbi:alkyl hydroperoxide reductase subunit F [Polynucleobacter wuianus]|uniref:Alkyl hydroperoxide reductase subunit F n=1 Tax=Polynucleobacter wuianus TaxID=1743168 RepID=A0A191UGU0_9BURK|nr:MULTISPECIES: alkyl hydroperoxide reductase subunit F [Polynucleobacter]ANJ00193.1 alkyl hydroperoxide reductase subunit F [Polynucleobacter wuianus]MBU3553458.1 alkyl hydroperoxide reductase subunit F [Polynucleobacter sp. MWH-Post4-6-1]